MQNLPTFYETERTNITNFPIKNKSKSQVLKRTVRHAILIIVTIIDLNKENLSYIMEWMSLTMLSLATPSL
jgi:hypothetical protein